MDVSNILATQITSSACIVYIMQRLKSASWFPLVETGKAKLNRAVSVAAAFFSAVGISWSWSLDQSSGTHTLIIAGIGFYAVLHGAWHWLNQYAMQELIYQSAVNKPAVTTSAKGAIPAMIAPGGAVVVPADPLKQ